jgi:hypothetical protein
LDGQFIVVTTKGAKTRGLNGGGGNGGGTNQYQLTNFKVSLYAIFLSNFDYHNTVSEAFESNNKPDNRRSNYKMLIPYGDIDDEPPYIAKLYEIWLAEA